MRRCITKKKDRIHLLNEIAYNSGVGQRTVTESAGLFVLRTLILCLPSFRAGSLGTGMKRRAGLGC